MHQKTMWIKCVSTDSVNNFEFKLARINLKSKCGQCHLSYFFPAKLWMVGGQTMNAKSKPGCVLCEFVMHRVREWLQDGHTVDELEEGLDEICNMMPNSVKVCQA